jgi:hypothetical protein
MVFKHCQKNVERAEGADNKHDNGRVGPRDSINIRYRKRALYLICLNLSRSELVTNDEAIKGRKTRGVDIRKYFELAL